MSIKKIGNIQIGKEIGRGGFGVMYSGIDTNLNRKVAVKIIDTKSLKEKNIESDIQKEAITQGQLNHLNIVSVYNFDKIDSKYFIVFEFVEGNSLKTILDQKNTISLDLSIKYLKQMLRGLYFAHLRNIVHYDIKPSNIMITNSNVIKITDFGISQLFGMSSRKKDEQWYGTPVYASPEQLLGISSDFRSDIYSLGVTVFFMLTGAFPFDIDLKEGISKSILQNDRRINYPYDIDQKIKKFIDVFILKALKTDVEMRYQNVLEMLEILDNIDDLL